jgi:hypothetical protein
MGFPEMDAFWNDLTQKRRRGSLSQHESTLYNKLAKALRSLSENPRHPGLESHAIDALSRRYAHKVWQSCLENKTPAAGRLFWVYGPGRGEITVIGLEPRPEDNRFGYARVRLSRLERMDN